jgi:chromosome segregation ATPase
MLRNRRNSTNSVSTTSSAENDASKGKWGFGSKKSPKNADELQAKHQEAIQALIDRHQEEVEELKAQIAHYEEHDKEMSQQAEQEHESMQLLVDQMEELTAQLNAKEGALQQAEADQELMEVLKAKVMAFESESPVNEQLSSLAARQKKLEQENQQLKEQVEAKTTTKSDLAVPDEATVDELKHTIKHLEKQLEVAEIKQQNLKEDHTQALAKAKEAHAEEKVLLESKHTQEVESLNKEIQKLPRRAKNISLSSKDRLRHFAMNTPMKWTKSSPNSTWSKPNTPNESVNSKLPLATVKIPWSSTPSPQNSPPKPHNSNPSSNNSRKPNNSYPRPNKPFTNGKLGTTKPNNTTKPNWNRNETIPTKPPTKPDRK